MERGSDRTPDQDRGIKVGRKSLEIRGKKAPSCAPARKSCGGIGKRTGNSERGHPVPPRVRIRRVSEGRRGSKSPRWRGPEARSTGDGPGGLRFALSDGPRGFLSFSGPWRASGDLGSPFPVFWEFLIFFPP
ncbi:hypothetical protein TNCT_234291 [Trichonephila clavata]|uniref:Uncharacterized protein n=1 Tax=Trichonephila clavata TaxID=2740835 RepID=A0A8X6K5S2_TRICU|nr:hypothetical protein TNCT_230551 [Trichonephila clavata]GFR26786.1 hypothetical protein TNCT_154831 [Trichonephila clavata]GFR32721.1 hypothetical protein TNCT_234291 [Trichonephila clavata]